MLHCYDYLALILVSESDGLGEKTSDKSVRFTPDAAVLPARRQQSEQSMRDAFGLLSMV